MRVRELFAAGALATVVLSSCATSKQATPLAAPSGAYHLYAMDGRLTVLDATTGNLERSLPAGALSANGSRLYAITHESGGSMLRDIDVPSGQVAHAILLRGTFGLPVADYRGTPGGLSQDGRWLVLEGQAGARSSFALVDTSFRTTPRLLTLTGHFTFDAVSNDGQRLYLIESLTAIQPGHYRVRQYDFQAGSLNPNVVVDKRESSTASMTGTRISGIYDPHGSWLYSLYINQRSGPFIHALNLDSPFAWCIDLPAGGDDAQQMMWSLALAPDRQAIYAVNALLGKVAKVDIGSDGPDNEVRVTKSFAPGTPAAQAGGLVVEAEAKGMAIGFAAVSADGGTLFAAAGTGIEALDTASLGLRRHLVTANLFESVVLSEDGKWLFASSLNGGPGVYQINPTTGASARILSTNSILTLYRAGLVP